MPLTSGEIGIGALITTTVAVLIGWIKYIAGQCDGIGERVKDVEDTVAEKSGVIDVHGSNLCAGEKKMNEMKAELKILNQGISELHLLGVSTAGKIDALGEKIKTGINEVFLKLNPRLEQTEKHIDCLRKAKKEKEQ